MDLNQATEENLEFLLHELAKFLDVANKNLFEARHYDVSKYDHLKTLYDYLSQKGSLSAAETQAFIDELRKVRKE